MRSIASVLVAAAIAAPGCQADDDPVEEEPVGEVSSELAGSSLGMVVDDVTGTATVFDANTNTILGTVPGLTPGSASGDCSITADGTKGFFTNFNATVTVANLAAMPPTLAGAPNPIAISNPGEDTALSPDGKFLVVCDGSAIAPISVIDVATQAEIGTFDTGSDCNSVDVCSDGSVLVTSFNTNRVRRLAISGSGVLTDTGESLIAAGGPMNVYCSPAATAGVVVENNSNSAVSFKIPGLAPVSTRTFGGFGVSGAINHAGDRAYFRSLAGPLTAFTFDETTGVLGGAPLFMVPIAPAANSYFGMDQLAVHPSDATLYVPEPGALRIFNAATGAATGSIIGGSMSALTGVCFGGTSNQPPVAKCADRTVPADGTCHGSASIDDGSFDPDGDPIVCTQVPSGPYGEGTTIVTLECTDSHGERSKCTASVTVVDTTPPQVSTTAVGPLWPPNHKYRRIDLAACIASIQDACDGTLAIASHASVTCCTSDEPDHGLGDGDTAGDCVIVDGDSVDVRAERGGGGNGRVYTIHYAVTDDSNNTTSHTCKVGVPHSNNGGPAIDDGAQTTCP